MNGIWAARSRASGNDGGDAIPDAAKMKKPRNRSSQKLRIGSSVQIEPYYSMCRRSLGVHKLYLLFWSGCINNLLLANRLHKFGLVCAAHEKKCNARARAINMIEIHITVINSNRIQHSNAMDQRPHHRLYEWMRSMSFAAAAQSLCLAVHWIKQQNTKIDSHHCTHFYLRAYFTIHQHTTTHILLPGKHRVQLSFCIFEFELKPIFFPSSTFYNIFLDQ